MSVVVLVQGEDSWDGIYVDGRLVFENHSLPVWLVLSALKGVHVTDLFRYTCAREWLDEQGSYPCELSLIPMEVLT